MKVVKTISIAMFVSTISLTALADSGHHDDEGSKSSIPEKAYVNNQMPMMGKDMPMMEMMQQRHAMMDTHMKKMETHMANVEALLEQLVELQKTK